MLGGPQRVLVREGANDEATLERNSGLGKRGCIGQVRRIDPRNQALFLRGTGERAREESHLTDARAVVQHLGERGRRPASSGQLAIERRVTSRQRDARRLLELSTAPHTRNSWGQTIAGAIPAMV